MNLPDRFLIVYFSHSVLSNTSQTLPDCKLFRMSILGWLPAFRCIPCHCHDCGVTDSSCIPCLDALISPRFPLLLPAYGSAGTLPVPGSFLLRNPSHSISADTSIRSGFAPAHRTGTHPVGIHMTHMTFCTASIDILILHSSHCAIPVVQQVFLTVIHCFFVRRTFPDSFIVFTNFSSCPYTEPSTAVLWLPLPHPASGWPPC